MKKNKSGLIAVILIISAAFSLSYTSSTGKLLLSAERSRAGLKTKTAVVNNDTIVYSEGGEGETVLLIHGFGADKDNWLYFSKELTGRYHVIAPDLPGFGESTKNWNEHYDIDSQVKRLHSFVVKLGLKKFHIAGNSMGGLISGLYATSYPDEILSLGLLDSLGVKGREKSVFIMELEKGNNPLVARNADEYDRLLEFVCTKQPFIPGPVKKYFVSQAVSNFEFHKKVFSEIVAFDSLEKSMDKIKTKTIIIWGDTDRIFPESSAVVLNKGIKDSKLVIIKKCGHLPMVEYPEETGKIYFDFLKSI